jgi:uncharacterized protein YecE (DUF72 family)
MNNLFVGTAGWSYKDWVPNFYPKAHQLRLIGLSIIQIF